LTVLARLVKNDASIEPQTAFNLMKQDGITKAADVAETVRPVSRIELAILFKRAVEKYAQAQPTEETTEETTDSTSISDILGSILGETTEETTTQEAETTTTEEAETPTEEVETTTEEDNTVTTTENVLTVALDPATPAAQNIPYNVAVVEYTRVDVTAGSEDSTIKRIRIARGDLGSRDDFGKVWLVVDGVRITSDKSLNSDDYVDFNLNYVVKAGETKTISVMASMNLSTASTKVNKLGVVEIDASTNVE